MRIWQFFHKIERFLKCKTPNTKPPSYSGASVRLVMDIASPATDAPSTATDSSSSLTDKVLRNGQLLIIRKGKTYNVLGAEVK